MEKLVKHLPKLVLAPSMIAVLWFVYGFIVWTLYISLTNSRLLPSYKLAGIRQYVLLFSEPRWFVALKNLLLFGGLFVLFCVVLGVLLAILLDQRIRAEGFIRTIYLYPMALSFIVTGTAWKWMLNPGLGLERLVRTWGWESFRFDWLVNPDRAIYTVVIAGVWQSSGFVMALFLAGLRSVNVESVHAAMMEGANLPRIYRHVVLPQLKPVLFSAVIVLTHIAIKSFDLVVALTAGGPGYATDLPALYMFSMAFSRGNIGQAAASATVMMATVFAIMVPYMFSELRGERHAS